MKITAIPPLLPSSVLKDADWADAFACDVAKPYASAREIAECTIGHLPGWARKLGNLRNLIVIYFGLKPGVPVQKSAALKNSKSVSVFPIIEETDNRIVLGFDDWHLNFRVVIEKQSIPGNTHIVLTSLIKRHNFFGHAYLFVIMPFHKVIIRSALKQAA